MAMSMCRVDRVLLAVHWAAPPSDDEWDRWIELTCDQPGAVVRALVEAYDEVGPNAKQRKALADRIRVSGRDVRSAILTDSVIVRGIVTAIAWLSVSLRAFATNQHHPAASYLELTDSELDSALATLPGSVARPAFRSTSCRAPPDGQRQLRTVARAAAQGAVPVGVGLPTGGALGAFLDSTQSQWASHSVRLVSGGFDIAGPLLGSAPSQREIQSEMRCRQSLLTMVAQATDDRVNTQARTKRIMASGIRTRCREHLRARRRRGCGVPRPSRTGEHQAVVRSVPRGRP